MIWTHDLQTYTVFIYPIDHFAFGMVASTLGGLGEVTLDTSNINQQQSRWTKKFKYSA